MSARAGSRSGVAQSVAHIFLFALNSRWVVTLSGMLWTWQVTVLKSQPILQHLLDTPMRCAWKALLLLAGGVCCSIDMPTPSPEFRLTFDGNPASQTIAFHLLILAFELCGSGQQPFDGIDRSDFDMCAAMTLGVGPQKKKKNCWKSVSRCKTILFLRLLTLHYRLQ